MRNTLETRLGLFVALALIAAAVILEMLGGLDYFKKGMTLKAYYNNVRELKVGDPVKIAGKPVGRVQSVEFATNRLAVLMNITNHKVAIPVDSKATIKFSGLLGENYLEISLGTNTVYFTTPNQTIETEEAPDVEALLSNLNHAASNLKKITENLSDVKLDQPIALLTDFLKENRPRVAGILTNAEAISAQIAAGKGTVGKLIYDDRLYADADTTLTNFNAAAQDVRTAVDEAKALIADVNAGKGTIGRLVRDAQLYNEVAAAATNLKEILEKINRGKGSVGKLINDESLINNAKLTLQKLDKATEALEDQGPLTVLGILVNPLL